MQSAQERPDAQLHLAQLSPGLTAPAAVATAYLARRSSGCFLHPCGEKHWPAVCFAAWPHGR